MVGSLEQVGNRLDALQAMNQNLAAMKGQLNVTNRQLSKTTPLEPYKRQDSIKTNAGLQTMKGHYKRPWRLGTMNGELAGTVSGLLLKLKFVPDS